MNSPIDTQAAALRNLRIAWGVILSSELVTAGVLSQMVLQSDSADATDAHLGRLCLYASTGLFAVFTLAAYFIRNQIYKRHWREHAIAPEGYFLGNLILLAMMEVVVIVGLVLSILVSGIVFPTLYPALAAAGVQLVNFPSGLPMQPMPPTTVQHPAKR